MYLKGRTEDVQYAPLPHPGIDKLEACRYIA